MASDHKVLEERIRQFIKRRLYVSGTTQEQLAEAAGLDAGTVSKWLAGVTRQLKQESRARLVKAALRLPRNPEIETALAEAESLAAVG